MAINHFRIHRGLTLTPQTSAPSSPVDGDMYFDSTLAKLRVYQSGAWVNVTDSDGTVLLADGSAASPSLSFVNDPDSGLYSAAANQPAIASNGTKIATFTTAGITISGTGTGPLYGEIGTTFINGTVPTLTLNPSANFTAAGASDLNQADTAGLLRLSGGGNFTGAGISLGSTAGGTPNVTSFRNNAVVTGSISAAGLWNIGASGSTETHIVNGSLALGGSSASGVINIGATQPLSGVIQSAFRAQDFVASSAATSAGRAFAGTVKTANAAFTMAVLSHFFSSPAVKGAASTVTNAIGFFQNGSMASVGATNYASFANNSTFTGNWFINSTDTNPSLFSGQLQGSGTVSLPAFSFTGATGDGLYSIASGTVGIAASGASVLQLSAALTRSLSPFGATDGNTAAPSYAFTSDVSSGFSLSAAKIRASISGVAVTSTEALAFNILSQGELRLQDTTGGEYVGLRASGTQATYTITLPAAAPGSNTFLKYDGANYVWASSAGAGDINNGGNSFGSAITIGTNDAFGLNLETNNVTNFSITSAGLVSIGASAANLVNVVNGRLDIISGTNQYGLQIGADDGGVTRTNSTAKRGTISVPHYTNAASPVAMIEVYSDGSANTLSLGGDHGNAANAATIIRFYTGATQTTAGGTSRGSIDSSGAWIFGTSATTASHSINASDGNVSGASINLNTPAAVDTFGLVKDGTTGRLRLAGGGSVNGTHGMLSLYGSGHATNPGQIQFNNVAGIVGSITNAGLWTLGESGNSQTHVVNGSVVNFTPSTASSDMTLQHGQQNGRIILSSDNRGFSTRGGSIVMYGNGHATENDNIEFYRAGSLYFKISSSGGAPLLNTTGKMTLSGTIGVGGADSVVAIATLGTTNPLSNSRQWGALTQLVATSAATHATSAVVGFYSANTTAATAFTAPNRYGFYNDNTAKGAGSTITRDVAYGGLQPTQGTNNAYIADNSSFTGDFFINTTSTKDSVFAGRIGLGTSASLDQNIGLRITGSVLSGAVGTTQWGQYIDATSTASATAEYRTIHAEGALASSAFTCGLLTSVYANYSFASATATRYVAFYKAASSGTVTNQAVLADNASFSGNYFINSTSTNASVLGGRLTAVGVTVSDNILASTGNTFDIGSSGTRFASAFVQTLNASSSVTTAGNIISTGLGNGLQIKEGADAKMGKSTLVAGTVTVSTTAVTNNSRIFLTHQNNSGTIGFVTVSARTNGTSFVITSSNAADTSDIAWILVEPS